MVTKGKAERMFTSPAGALTLLRAGGWSERLDLLGRLELSRYQGLNLLLDVWEEPCGATRDPQRRQPLGSRSEADAEHAVAVADALARWLHRRPSGPLMLGAESVEAVVAMACGWSTAVLHALAERPVTFEELAEEIDAILDEEILEEHVELLVRTGQAEIFQELGRPLRYQLTEWGREALAPLICAVRREAHLPDEDILPPEILDVEAAFKLALPLLALPDDLVGSCHLCVLVDPERPLVAGAKVDVAGGGVLATSILLEEEPETWVRGTPREWCDALVDPGASPPLRGGGDEQLGEALIAALSERLFGAAR